MACEKYKAIPIDEPMASPNEREMIKYSPPPSTFWFVAISAIAIAVGMVTACPTKIMTIVPIKPTFPTAYPKRKNITAPRMVEIAVKKTGAVPNFRCRDKLVLILTFLDLTSQLITYLGQKIRFKQM